MTAKSDEMDIKIARLQEKVADEKAQTEVVVKDLRVVLRHNRILSTVAKVAMGVHTPDILLLEDKRPHHG